MEPYLIVRAVAGLIVILATAGFAAKRALFLYRHITSGQPAVGRTDDVPKRAEVEVTEVLGQKKLLKWTVPGIAHVFAFWGFLVLGITVAEAFGELFIDGFAFPIIGTWPIVRFMEDLFAVLVVVGIAMFAIIRLTNSPAKKGRYSRFFGSHLSGAWIVLGMIFLVVFTLLMYRGAKVGAALAVGTPPAASGWTAHSPRSGSVRSSNHSGRRPTTGSRPSSWSRTSP